MFNIITPYFSDISPTSRLSVRSDRRLKDSSSSRDVIKMSHDVTRDAAGQGQHQRNTSGEHGPVIESGYEVCLFICFLYVRVLIDRHSVLLSYRLQRRHQGSMVKCNLNAVFHP